MTVTSNQYNNSTKIKYLLIQKCKSNYSPKVELDSFRSCLSSNFENFLKSMKLKLTILVSHQSKVTGRYIAPLTIEKLSADDLDVDDNHVLTVENSNGKSEFLITIR